MTSLLPKLPRKAWIILGGNSISAVGTGLVLPFLIVYLREVRHIQVQTAGLVIATIAVVGLAGGPVGGSLVDRFGSRRMLLAALCVCASGSLLTAQIHSVAQAFLATGVFGLGLSTLWPATHSLLASIAPEKERPGAFAVHYASLNAGIGLGGIVGGLLADVSRPQTFELMYRLDALSWLLFGVVLFLVKDVGMAQPVDTSPDRPPAGYRQVVSDRIFMRLMGIMTLFIVVAFSQLNSGFVAYARFAGVSTRAVGIAFAANTFTVVSMQLVVLRFLARRRRTRALVSMFGLAACAWVVTIFAAHVDGVLLRDIGFAVAMSIFALGECLLSPTVPGIVNDLSPEHLRGRYNASYSLVFSIGSILGPTLAGFFLGAGLGDQMFLGFIVACGLAAYLVLRLEKRIPPDKNYALGSRPAVGEEVAGVQR
jgi:MFS family permease